MVGSAIDLSTFNGMLPRSDARLLPSNAAQKAVNVRLLSGILRGIRGAKFLYDTGSSSNVKAFRFPDPEAEGGFTWVPSDSTDEDVFRGALINDAYDRVYRFGGGSRPTYNTLDRIREGEPWYWLGSPTPDDGFIVDPPQGGAEETRAYVYTFVSPFGEESPPTTPVIAEGTFDGTWELTDMETSIPDQAHRADGYTKRIYRTVTGFTSTEFFFVAEIPLADATYSDSASNEEASRNSRLESTYWTEPPQDLEGAVQMPNGFFIAWSGQTVYLSEPYRPHAWPVPYELAVEYNVVGIGVYGQTAIIGTEGSPYSGTGVNPASITLSKIDSPKPCLSRRGIVAFPDGVLYPSPNGLIRATPAGAQVITQGLLTKEEWLASYNPSGLIAARFDTGYLGFYTEQDGFMVDPSEPASAFTELDAFTGVTFIHTDPYTGDVFLTRNGRVYLWDSPDEPRQRLHWRSKKFTFVKPCNLGAMIVESETFIEDDEEVAFPDWRSWNEYRIQYPLAPVGGGGAIGGTSSVPPPTDPEVLNPPQIQDPVAGSALFWISRLLGSSSVYLIRVYADGKMVYQRGNLAEGVMRLPSGFKARDWEIEVFSYVPIYSIKVAETGKGLERV